MSYNNQFKIEIAALQRQLKVVKLRQELYLYCVSIDLRMDFAKRVADGCAFGFNNYVCPFPNNMNITEEEANKINQLLSKINK